GTAWVSKLMPPVIIGPTVAIIGLSLAGSAMGDIVKASVGTAVNASYNLVALLCGLITFITVVICSTQKRFKMGRLIPFIIGIGVGYAFASFFSIFGYTLDVDYLKIINWAPLVDNFKVLGDAAASAGDKVQAFFTYPDFALIEAIKEIANGSTEVGKTYFFESAAGFGEVAIAFIPVALVVFAEHIADHKNLSSIINRDLVEGEPGLKRTLLGDGVGSMVGTVFGICPNTTYGESVGCVAITKNASVSTLFTAAIMCIILSFMSPIMALLQTIPSCVMGGVCLTLYGFIAVSGLKMFKDIDLGENKNLFTVSAILIAGIGGLAIKIPYHIAGSDVYNSAGQLVMAAGTVDKTITITSIATALILGIITYAVINAVEKKNAKLPDTPDDDASDNENAINAPVMAESTYEVGVDVTTLNENKEKSEKSEEKVSDDTSDAVKSEQ
ncbi:MAG: uracil-xanthine permease family protein, partial [Christensenellales bacterium]